MIKLKELIEIPVKVGDIILTGRFKNKKTVVKTIGVDERGMPTINGKKVVTFRIYKEPKQEGLKFNAAQLNPNAVGAKKGDTAHFMMGSIVKNIERLYPRQHQFKGILVKQGKNEFKKYKVGDEVTFSITNALKITKK